MENQDTIIKAEVTSPKNKILRNIIMGIILIIVSVSSTYYYLNNFKGIFASNNKQDGNDICKGVKITFFPGGNPTDSFASVVYNGARAAELELGATVEYVWSDWDSSKMVNQLIDTIAKSPDAIAIMGHPGSEILRPLISEAERKNIIITSQNVDLPDLREKYSSNGFGYVGQSLHDSGLMVSSAVVRKYNLREGEEAIVFGVSESRSPSRYQRTKGNIDGFLASKLIVHEVSMSPEVEKDLTSTTAEKMLLDAILKYAKAKVIITDHGALTASIPKHFKNLGIKPGEKIVAGFDLSADTVDGIKNGYLDLVLDQQPYLQGYLPILQSCLTKKYGFAGLYINTGVGLIDKSNIDLVAGFAAKKIR